MNIDSIIYKEDFIMRKTRSVLAVLLASAMLVGSLAGCGAKENTTPEGTQAVENSTTNNDTPLVIANDDMSEKFSPFFGQSVPDQNVWLMTQVALLGNDRSGELIYNGIKGETKSYNGTDYYYNGIADLVITENADGTVFYDFTLRDDVKFSDGEILNADDAIFSYYVLCDPSYDGSSSTYALPILGMEEYRSGSEILYNVMLAKGADNTDFTYYTEEQQKQFFEVDFPAAGEAFAKSICDYCVSNGYVSLENEVANGMMMWGFGTANEDGTFTAKSGKTYTMQGEDVPTLADYWFELCEAYAYDYVTLSDTEAAEGGLFTYLPDSYKITVQTGESAANIAGIQKTGEFSFRVVLTEVDATAVYQLAISVAPMHYYGDASLYDYDNNKFGFVKGDLSSVRAKTTTPMGAGPYKFVSYENKIAYMEANENYFNGVPATKYIQWKTTAEPDKVPGVIQGVVDISEPSISKAALAQITGENSNGTISGDKLATLLVDYNGYGYIGLNSKNVSVGGDGASEASKNLRKAIATVISVYRDVTIDSYYGEAASVINYPISNTSWAAPQKSDADYRVAFSTDVNGDPIYTDGMSDDEKYAAALDAAVEYFAAAGYTVENGKLTAAPEGAKMSYELLIGASGTGDHPSFGIVTAAAEALKTIGFDLVINDLSDTNILWNALSGRTAEIWCAAWGATLDPDMFQIYHSEGGSSHYYAINTEELDALVMDGRTNTNQEYRKAVYKEALDYVVDFAVEVPIYQRQEAALISAERVNMDTVAKDTTSVYTWLAEIDKIAMK